MIARGNMIYNNPKVTIGIPTYNRKCYLKEALDSISAQRYPNIEVVISDNASNDGTDALVASYIEEHKELDIKYFRNTSNLGAALNWKNCLENASGEYFMFLSDDDGLMMDSVENMVIAMESDVAFVVANLKYVNSSGTITGEHINPTGKISEVDYWRARLSGGYHDTPSSVMFRIELIRKVFSLAVPANTAGDLAVTLLMSHYGNASFLPNVFVWYRIHEGNDSKNIFKCASSHVALWELMKSKAPNEKSRDYLRDYCMAVICGHARMALRAVSPKVALNCLVLLKEGFGISSSGAVTLFFKLTILRILQKIFGDKKMD